MTQLGRASVAVLLGILLAAGGLAAEEAKPVLPAGLIPTPDKPGIVLSLKTDKGVYAPGEALRLTFTLPRPAYVYVYNLTSAGRVQLIVPNRFLQDSFFPAGTHTLPTRGWVLRLTEPEGVEYLQLVASETPLSFYEAKGFEKDAFLVFTQPAAFAGTIQGLLGGNWGAVWTAYRVYKPKAYVSVTTVPPGAAVSVDGQAVGLSPVSTVVSPGRIRVQASRAGYETRSVQLTVTDGEEVHLSLTLSPSRPAWPPLRPTLPPSGGAPQIDVDASVGVAVGADSIALDLWVAGLGFGASVRPAPPRPDLTQPGPGGEYPWGPEVEAYLALWVPFGRGGALLLGGLSAQDMAWIPAWSPAAVRPQVVVEPEVWSQYRVTFGVGIGIVGDGWRGHVLWHNRRGPVLGFVLSI
ncbi:MAG: hypothetical protein BIP78_0470 [Candidatus Bipolaricaulis sibiricus]|uniref:PEGA domain-containing protein n=1 Tax=Bipolaricaulis sibiricus TaxID=2501609 RepID=A0A410FT82_BIPS1|nr:MAG: hypothetical protein BIP78_0470 [Candidatus Bipolaricaulis sibiricus]